MSYIQQQKVVHGDLSARNVLVRGTNIKIADFGEFSTMTCRDVTGMAIHQGQKMTENRDKIAVRWQVSHLQFDLQLCSLQKY